MKNNLKILFVSSGNTEGFDITPFIFSQGESLKKIGVQVDNFLIMGNGIRGYLKNIFRLRKHLKKNKYDIIHAHYTLCAWVALLTWKRNKIVLSILGADLIGEYRKPGRKKIISPVLYILTKSIQPFVSYIIVKSENVYRHVNVKSKCTIIPNGVDMELFKPADKISARKHTGLSLNKNVILFLGDPDDPNKNSALARKAYSLLDTENTELIIPYPVSHDNIPFYINAADVLILTSLSESSPNVLKEAMACNCPIVTTDVGDAKWLTGNTEGCYIADYTPGSFAEELNRAIEFSKTNKKTSGQQRIRELELGNLSVAKKIREIYISILT
ncbi:MAG: glycosyltransferase family 4 protein [Bacteroidota bacterium]